MFNKDKLSWSTRLKLCWEVFTRGKYDPRDYKTIKEQEAWERCEQMRKELAAAERPRPDVEFKSEWWVKMYKYNAKIIRVVDADTLDAMIDLGFNTWVKKRIRLSGIDAYETRTRDKEEKAKGLAAKARVEEVLERNNNEVLLISHGVGKYGRCLGELRIAKSYIRSGKYHGKIINEMLLKEGHAKEYKG